MLRTISRINVTYLLFACAAAGIGGCKSDTASSPTSTDDSDTTGPCDWDQDNDLPDGADNLSLDTPEEQFICPSTDQDWYRLTVPNGADLLRVRLAQGGPVASVNPVYTIFEEDGTTVSAAPDSTESAGIDEPLEIVHAVPPGEYYIRVLDQAQDAPDNYHPYTLTVSALSDPDVQEPDNDAADAADIGDGTITGYIAYRGDEDWYKIESPARGILHVSLTLSGGIAPSYRVLDADETDVVIRANEDGLSSYDYYDSLADEGTYYIVVYNEDSLTFDTEISYTMEISVSSDPDTNEDNDTPEESTPLNTSPTACGSDWSDWASAVGYIASSGDIDWYQFDVSDSETGIIEVEVAFDSSVSLPEDLRPAVRLVYAAEKSCTMDQDCQSLATACTQDIDCSRLGNTCLTAGLCGGSGNCMPGGTCGATLIYRTSAADETSDPNASTESDGDPNTVRVAAPLFGISTIYIAVEDYKGDALSATASYTVRARVATDTDAHEPSEAYLNRAPQQDDDVTAHEASATVVPVHTCIDTDENDCCDATTWVEGAISYTYDQDWYRYEHPCPEEDCMVRINYETEAGEVDTYMMVYREGSLWHDEILPSVSDTGDQAAMTGACGGLEADDTCFYAYHLHDAYYFSVRDTVYVSEGNEDNGTWDWNKDQHYRFCIEKIADECLAPCHVYDAGCGFMDETDTDTE